MKYPVSVYFIVQGLVPVPQYLVSQRLRQYPVASLVNSQRAKTSRSNERCVRIVLNNIREESILISTEECLGVWFLVVVVVVVVGFLVVVVVVFWGFFFFFC